MTSRNSELECEIKRAISIRGTITAWAQFLLLEAADKFAQDSSLGRDHELIFAVEAASTGDAQGLLLTRAQGLWTKVEAGDVDISDDAGIEAVTSHGVDSGESDGGSGLSGKGHSCDGDGGKELHGWCVNTSIGVVVRKKKRCGMGEKDGSLYMDFEWIDECVVGFP